MANVEPAQYLRKYDLSISDTGSSEGKIRVLPILPGSLMKIIFLMY